MTRPRAELRGAGARYLDGRRAGLWVVWGLAVVGCAAQQKKDQPTVKDLKISGNREVSSREIKNRILTSKTGWWPFATKQLFDPVAWQADRAPLRRQRVLSGRSPQGRGGAETAGCGPAGGSGQRGSADTHRKARRHRHRRSTAGRSGRG